MKLEFIGAAHEVTGSCHYLNVGTKNILVDCGMKQGPDLYVRQEMPVNASDIDYVFVTHAHIDHSGLLPLLYKNGFKGSIFATKATCQLCDIMLRDSAHIQEFETEWKNRKARRAGKPEVEPIYNTADAEGVLQHFVPCVYDERLEICSELSIRFVDAGHLLGSSSIEIWATEGEEEVKIAFSGDLGPGDKPLIKDPEYILEADYILTESTYGDRYHENPPDYGAELAKVIKSTFAQGGNLVIPAFSVGRTQEILYWIRKIKHENLLPEYQNFLVYMDSPLALEATNIFHESVFDCFDEEAAQMVRKGMNPIGFPGLCTAVSSDESKMINFVEEPIVIISASGMCEAGRIRHHLKHNLWRPECTVLFVGYQVPGTLGNALINGAQEVKIFGETIEVKAHIENMPGFSGHADKGQLLTWIKAFQNKPKRVFVVHGEDSVAISFAKVVTEECGIEAVAPFSGDVYDLLSNECVEQGSHLRVVPKMREQRAQSVFERHLQAGDRLMALLRRNEGMSNKDISKLTDQINSLCDKWEHRF